MGVGHIKLGVSVATFKDYVLTDPRARVQELANPYAAKVGMGAGKFDDLTTWSAWVMDNWEAGIGREKATDGGLAYSNLDSRVPNQLILPPAMGRVAAIHGSATAGEQQFMAVDCSAYETVTIGAGQTYDTILVKVKTGTGIRRAINLYGRRHAAAVGDMITIQQMVWSDVAGAPGVLLSTSATWGLLATAADMKPDYKWFDGGALYASFADNTYYWVGFRVTAGYMTFLLGTGNSSSSTVVSPNGAAPWTTRSTDAIFQVCEDNEASVTLLPARQHAWMGDTSTGKTYMIADQNGALACYQYIEATNTWTLKATLAATVTLNSSHCAEWLGDIYIPAEKAGVTSYVTYTQDAVAFGTVLLVGQDYDGFAAGQGYLWAWKGNKVYYTNQDAIRTWTGPIEVGSPSFVIKSMCAFGDFMYVATEDALWYIGYGDVPIGVVRFPSRSSETGVSMVEFQGTLYVTVGGRVWQYSSTGQVLDVWFPYTGDTDVQRGDVVNLCSSGQNLYATALPQNLTNDSWSQQYYVYSWNGQGWHPILTPHVIAAINSTGYSAVNPSGWLYYGRAYNKLFLLSSPYYTYWVRIPDSFRNPFRDTASKYAYTGYCTTPWFDGELIDVVKDFESVFVTGEALTTTTKVVDIYWQDDESVAWEYLGRADAIEEIRWSTYSTRPNTRRFRLALAFYTTSPTATPQVTGVRVKYRANVEDRWRWTLPILVSANQQFPDGTINPQTAAQMRTSLNALARQVPPIFFQDVDGTQYECWVTNCRRQIVEYEYYNTAHQWSEQYLLTLEQVQSGTVN